MKTFSLEKIVSYSNSITPKIKIPKSVNVKQKRNQGLHASLFFMSQAFKGVHQPITALITIKDLSNITKTYKIFRKPMIIKGKQMYAHYQQ